MLILNLRSDISGLFLLIISSLPLFFEILATPRVCARSERHGFPRLPGASACEREWHAFVRFVGSLVNILRQHLHDLCLLSSNTWGAT